MNLFSAITSGLNAYNALSNTQTGQNMIGNVQQAIAPITQPITKKLEPTTQAISSITSPISNALDVTKKQPLITLFSNEKKVKEQMLADGLQEAEIDRLIREDRRSIYPNIDLNPIEVAGLKQMANDGLTSDEALSIIKANRDQLYKEQKKKYESMGTGEKIAKNVVGASLGAVSTIGSSAENIAGWGAKKLGFDALGEELQKNAQEWKQASAELGNDQAYSAGVTTGNVIGGAGAMLAAPGPTGLLGQGAGLGAKILAGAGEGALQGAGADIATNGETSIKNTAINAGIGGFMPVIGKGFEQLSKIPVSRIIPTTPSQAGKDIQKGLEIGKAIRDTGFSLTKGSLLKKVEGKIGDLSGKIDNAINTTIKTVGPKNITMNGITKGLKDSILKDPVLAKKLQGTPIDMKDIEEGMNETITAYKKLYGVKKLDLNAQQQLKKDIYNGLASTFSKADTAKLSARQVVEKQLAKTLKEGIETAVPEVKALNTQLAPYMEASKRLKAKGSYSGYLTDILAGGFASGSPQGIIDDPVGYMKSFATGVIAKRLGTSTASKTGAAQILKGVEKLFESPTFQKIIINQASQLTNQK